MADVAAAAGVSRTTASFVLNGRDAAIPSPTRQRVIRAAQKLGYRPNATARALATGRTRRIGIVLNEPESFRTGDMYFTEVLAGITVGAVCRDYNLLLHSAHYPDWQALYSDILSGAADGALLVGRYPNDELTPALLETDFPVVCISYSVDHPRCYSVDCENSAGAALAVTHLLELGHRHFAFLYPGEAISWGSERRSGAVQALAAAGLPPDNLHVFAWPELGHPTPGRLTEKLSGIDPWSEAEFASIHRFLKETRPRPTAAICCEESRAQMLVEALPAAGIRVPEDCAFISFNSTAASMRSTPPMTSVWQPLREIGAAAADLLVDLLEGESIEEPHRRFPMRLDVRESTRSHVPHSA